MDLFSMFLPFNLETFLITMCDGDTFPITEYILVCLYILKIWSDPCLSLLVCLLLLLLLHWRETIQTLAFHLFSDLATCDTVGNSQYYSCVCHLPYLWLKLKIKAILWSYILLNIYLCTTQWQPRMRGMLEKWLQEGKEQYLLNVDELHDVMDILFIPGILFPPHGLIISQKETLCQRFWVSCPRSNSSLSNF